MIKLAAQCRAALARAGFNVGPREYDQGGKRKNPKDTRSDLTKTLLHAPHKCSLLAEVSLALHIAECYDVPCRSYAELHTFLQV